MAKAFVDDVDALLIATTNIHNLTSTVMYARPRPGSTLLETLSARRKLGWDPRQVQAQRADLWSFARPELVGPGSTPEEGGGTHGGETLPMWLDRLAGALKQPGPALYAECVNIHKGMALQGELPTPQSLRLVLTADADPLLSAQIRFLSKEDAARAAAALPALRSKVSGQLFWLGLGGLLANLTFVTQDAVMEVKGRFSRGDVTVLMVWVKSWMPPPERIPGLVPPPPPPPPQGLDGGIGPDAGAGITP